jgi:hypothetical protein
MADLEEILLEKIGDKEIPVSDIYVEGYDDVEIYQALLTLELFNKIEISKFNTIIREDGGLLSVGVYKKK